MYDFTGYKFRALIEIRNAFLALKDYCLENEEALAEVQREIKKRERDNIIIDERS